jgi:hypothetical protein
VSGDPKVRVFTPNGESAAPAHETTLASEADGRTRTGDPFITSEVLYQLSYVGRDGSKGSAA